MEQARDLNPEYRLGNWVDFITGSRREIYASMKHFIAVLLRYTAMDESLLYQLQYAISEIFLNALEHGNQFDPNKQIRGSFVLFDRQLIVKIEDQGPGFNVHEILDPLESPRTVACVRQQSGKRPGGYGLALARKYMDIRYSNDGRCVLLSRDL